MLRKTASGHSSSSPPSFLSKQHNEALGSSALWLPKPFQDLSVYSANGTEYSNCGGRLLLPCPPTNLPVPSLHISLLSLLDPFHILLWTLLIPSSWWQSTVLQKFGSFWSGQSMVDNGTVLPSFPEFVALGLEPPHKHVHGDLHHILSAGALTKERATVRPPVSTTSPSRLHPLCRLKH